MCKKIMSTFLSTVIAFATILTVNVAAEEPALDTNQDETLKVSASETTPDETAQQPVADLNSDVISQEEANSVIEMYRYDNVQKITNSLYIQNGTANITSDVVGLSGTTRIEISSVLEFYQFGSWTDFRSFYKSGNGTRLVLSDSTSVPKSNYRYRVACTVTAYKGSSSETVTVYSNECQY